MSRQIEWIHFAPLSSSAFRSDCQLIVYKTPDDRFYFFGNALLWCLGYDDPHEDLQRIVPVEKQHTVPLGSGLFLDEETIRDIGSANVTFMDWFEGYLTKCKGNSDHPDCPT